jgi:hypothetical protein
MNLPFILDSVTQVMLKRRCGVFSPATQHYIFKTALFYSLALHIA